MDFDPLTRDAAPPRYALESGSEDDLPSAKVELPQIEFSFSASDTLPKSKGGDLVVLVAGAGRAWLETNGNLAENGKVVVSNEQQASMALSSSPSSNSSLFLFVSPSPSLGPNRYSEIAQKSLDLIQPTSLIIIDSYSPARSNFYGRSEEDRDRVKFLASANFYSDRISPDWTKLEAPESVTGVSAAFLTLGILTGVPVLLAQLVDTSPQDHAQLYGTGSGVRYSHSSQIDPSSVESIGCLVKSPPRSTVDSPNKTLLDLVQLRNARRARQNLGDNMYI